MKCAVFAALLDQRNHPDIALREVIQRKMQLAGGGKAESVIQAVFL